MKLLILLSFTLSLFACGQAQTQSESAKLSAQSSVVRGYTNLDSRNRPWFIAVNVDKLQLSNLVPYGFFNKAQKKVMYECMKRKNTHAIQVTIVPSTQRVPTSNGRWTTTHFPKYQNVRCVSAPGYLRVWRAIVRKSKFR